MRLAKSASIGYRTSLLRRSEIRSDRARVSALMVDKNSLFLPMHDSQPLVNGRLCPQFVSFDQCTPEKFGDWVFVGTAHGRHYFVVDVSASKPASSTDELGLFDAGQTTHPDFPDGFFLNLRLVLPTLEDSHLIEIVSTGKAVLGWHQTHQFCARCGTQTIAQNAGWSRSCPQCHAEHFPRNDPVVLMLVTSGNNILLGRSCGWPQGLYSLLAGFMEPGESVEAAVRREIMEEVGIRLGHVEYVASQGWPFPSALILGCRAQALHENITLDTTEVDDAFWISREKVADIYFHGHPEYMLSKKGTIANYLIQNWLQGTLY